ncbi:MAG TPA: M1 family metallopeptidase [Gemmatimonadaceae bacterium]
MDWPGPNQYRSADGTAGPAYWQQRADYDIRAALDTTAKELSGHVSIHYTNNSPDTLRVVWLQLDQNLYKPGSRGEALYPPESRFGVRGFEGGYQLANITVDGKPAESFVDDTRMRIELASPLLPKGHDVTIAMDYRFKIPEHGSDRMGRDSTLYEIAQWYPRMVVYDDVRGWNTDPYLGQGEFYLEYGTISYAVSVPAGYTVAGSGVLQNPDDVLTPTIRKRLAIAAQSDTIVPIITQSEAKAVATPGMKTWRFKADSVRDVAWAAAPDFRWDATSAKVGDRRVLTQSFYQWPKAGAEWQNVAENSQWTISTYSQNFYPYPYPQATSVAGPVAGMEYPMFVMDGYGSPEAEGDVFRTNDHELGHQWFPMVVGSNERRYAWMDEGINTYLNVFSQERRYGPNPVNWPRAMDNTQSFKFIWTIVHRAGIDAPLMTRPDQVNPQALGLVGYEKPAMVLLALRNHVVGRQAFDEAFRDYIKRWQFKHPTPGDFFRTIENVTGTDLAWFWRSFFYTADILDIGVDSVVNDSAGPGQFDAKVKLSMRTPVPFPVEMRLKLADGSTQDVRYPVNIWYQGKTYVAQIPVKSKVVGVRLWPDQTVPDLVPGDDTWGSAPPPSPLPPSTGGGLSTAITTRRVDGQ